jgi:putative flippase GtrA
LSPSTLQLLRFGLVGIGGLIVDTAVLYAAMNLLGLGLGLYSGRVVSYLAAATFTWAANRHFTFAQTDPSHPAFQWLKFLAANGLGAVVNYGVYAALVTFVPLAAIYPVIGIAAGSVVGLTFNFNASKRWVFKA